MKRTIQKIILCICAAVIAFCGWSIYDYYNQMHQTKDHFTQFVTSVHALDTESPVSYEELYAQNTDYRGWIWFDSNLISLPIVQTDQNDSYLKMDLTKEESLGGIPFIDAADSLTDQNLTIYGHTVFMDDSNLVFTPLKQLLNQGTYDQNKRFHIDWEDGVKTYQIFAVCNIDKDEDSWNYTQNIFQSDQDFYSFIHQAKNHSCISSDIDIKATDQLITLQTCAELYSSKKIVIIAKEVNE